MEKLKNSRFSIERQLFAQHEKSADSKKYHFKRRPMPMKKDFYKREELKMQNPESDQLWIFINEALGQIEMKSLIKLSVLQKRLWENMKDLFLPYLPNISSLRDLFQNLSPYNWKMIKSELIRLNDQIVKEMLEKGERLYVFSRDRWNKKPSRLYNSRIKRYLEKWRITNFNSRTGFEWMKRMDPGQDEDEEIL